MEQQPKDRRIVTERFSAINTETSAPALMDVGTDIWVPQQQSGETIRFESGYDTWFTAQREEVESCSRPFHEAPESSGLTEGSALPESPEKYPFTK